ncbi:hypothetical protein SAMN02745181_1633 [Rubritalea squalenifaciens DSM 18772]|uniref:Uncharacterized protein n=1 Tax=Rubritalea squalenifaciens DSM 18772 TaxID=1123071 RepID=A0A1M6HZN5_9BACT|nr:hypothetical protein [Rubritalea squalenifaciens]SHJ27719.1 hypothetical protein SAMN02745181_1633 [Rubritalea squalenifaciens DSM 18772]
MKCRNYFILPLVAGTFSFVSCDKKSDETQATDMDSGSTTVASDSVETVPPVNEVVKENAKEVEDEVQKAAEEFAEKAKEKAEDLVKPLVEGTVEQLAQQAGFAQYVPQGASSYFGLYDGAEMVKKLRASKLGVLLEELAEEEGESLDDVAKDPDFQQFATIAGEEMFLAVGEGGPEQTTNLVELADTLNFHQYKFYVKMMEALVNGKSLFENPEDFEQDNYLFDTMKHEGILEVFEKSSMPAIYLGFKVSDQKKRAALLGQIQGWTTEILDEQDVALLTATESDLGDGFKGVTLEGGLLAEQITGDVEEMLHKRVGKELTEKYKKIIAKKNCVMMAGSFKDYIVIFMGDSKEQLKFAESPSQSILVNKDMAFAKKFADKDLLGLIYSSEDLQKASVGKSSSLGTMALGVKAGLEEAEGFGDTRVLELLLEDLADCEKAVLSMEKGARLGAVAYLEDGFKFELFGGSNVPSQDFTTGRALASMTEGDDVLFSANWVSNPVYMERLMEYTDSLGATSYHLAKQVVEMDVEDQDFRTFSSNFQMFDGMLREDLLQVWKALRVDLAKGLGSESALVVDIKGTLPTIPGIPKPLLENGTVPRISYVSTVDDRQKVGQSWDKLNVSVESILAKISQMTGKNIPMQKPFKSTNEGLTSYTFPIPSTHQNCTPAAVVSDELFFLTSSPDFSTELSKKYDKSKLADPGATMTLDFEVLQKWAQQWYDLVDKHGEEFMSESEMDDFNEEVKPQVDKLFKAMDELDHLKIHTRMEEGELRSSLHLKVK